jgi:predicted phosphodiesterase
MNFMGRKLFLSDLHGRNPEGVVGLEQANGGLGDIVCLGDYDTPEIFRCLNSGDVPAKLVVGNHEYHYIDDLYIGSPLLSMSRKEYVELWEHSDNLVERRLVSDGMSRFGGKESPGVIIEDDLDGRKIVYVHAGIVDLSSPDSDAPGYVWTRLTNPRNIVTNFEKMKEGDYWVMFRGHDHHPRARIYPKDEKFVLSPSVVYQDRGSFQLDHDHRYIITLGAFVSGFYGILDEDNLTFEFKRV